MILVVAEQEGGRLHRGSWEAIAAAQQMAALRPLPIHVVLPGDAPQALAGELARVRVAEVVALASPLLATYTADAYTQAIEIAVADLAPAVVVLPHTYRTRDFAPRLAARLDRALITDVVSAASSRDGMVFVRPMFQGRLNADVAPLGPAPHLITIQAGAFRPDQAERAETLSPVRVLAAAIDPALIRQQPDPPFQESRQAVDLSQAERIVAVGRGIKDAASIAIAKELAEALGAELAASRPICDAGWLPMERQVGSSGQTVAPKLYVALGLSGAIQHLVGMKGSRTIVAINKDPDAPIFEVADYGIVGDLFEIVPAMIAALKS